MNKPQEGPRRALGKGLTALLPTRQHPPVPAPEHTADPSPALPDRIGIDEIDPNPLQPRRVFEPERLHELAASIRTNGIIQPIVVRPAAGRYQLVAGERRWRAAKLAGLDTVPVVIRQIPDERLLEITLVENIQREDLNPIETALAFDRLVRELQLSHEQIGLRTGKDRTTITNLIRLLQLPEDLQALVASRRLSQGHARCLLGIPTELQREVAEKVVAQGLSVRQVESLTQRMTETRKPKTPKEVAIDPNVKAAIQELERVLSTKVRIVEKSNNTGKIEIEYYSTEDLDRIYTAIAGDTTN
jgi:ParB family transcriptional regulator, chromosome partitioning protein